MRLFLVRHGETEWNRLGRYQGQSDIELNETGQEQARLLGRRLESELIDAIYCSDLKRAGQTVEPIASINGIKVTFTEELRELNFGDFEGKYFEEIGDQYIRLERAWRAGELDVTAPGAETLRQLGDRVTAFVARLMEEHAEGETVLLVAHGGPLQMMVCHLLGLDVQYWWRVHLSAASLSIFEIYPDLKVLSLLNDTCHLKGCGETK
jgi:alpha-ribazole phosphatase